MGVTKNYLKNHIKYILKPHWVRVDRDPEARNLNLQKIIQGIMQ